MPPEQASAPPGWPRLIADFEAGMQARGLSLRTIEHYGDILGRVLVPFLEREGIGPTDLSKRHLEKLAGELYGRELSRQSVKTYITAVNKFLAWCHEEEGLAKLSAPWPSVDRKVLNVLTRSEIQALEDAAVTERDKLIIRVLADCGLRLGELLRLTTDDLVVQGRERFLHVRGKGRRDRLVPLTPSLYQRLDRYVRRGRPECGTNALFVTLSRGPSGDYRPVAESTLQDLMTVLGRKAGISKRVYAHLLRHSLATHLLRKGTNPIQVRDILGHTSLAMIDRVYSHLTVSDAHKALMDALRANDD